MSGRKTFVLWRGRSKLDGAPIVAIGIHASSNAKTGAMLSVAIVPATGTPRRPSPSVCPGDCPLRDTGGCYVNWAFGASAARDSLPERENMTRAELAELGSGRAVRLGERGDPAAVPFWVWDALLSRSASRTGYSHDWRRARSARLSGLVMASVESPSQAAAAQRRGWRTYRIRPRGAALIKGEIDCPSARGVRCIDCGLCSGFAGLGGGAPSVSIEAHGGAVAAKVAQRIAR